MKKKLIHAGILAVIFIVAVVSFEYMTSKGNDNMMADIGNATLPRVYFSVEGYGLNPMNGYVKEMDVPSMRDGITPVTNGQLQMNIEAQERKVTSVEYKICTIDGESELDGGEIYEVKEQATLQLDEEILTQERVLILTLHMEEGDVYYYTRVVDPVQFHVADCLDYVYNFHENALEKEENAGIETAIEPSDDADNTTFAHVTIYSDYDHVTWGNLEPQVVGGERWKLLESNVNYSSVLLEYEVSCKGEENETDLYTVKEFFRVRVAAGNTYLLNYDRRMEQIFDGSKQVLSEKGVLLGITEPEIPYEVNADGTVVSFVQANELWNYNRDTDEMSLLFSFRDAENTDVRNKVSDHTIDILRMDKKGNTTFAVTGYMNRGNHEGRVGVAIYYYNISTNSIEEKAFIESDMAAGIAEEELGKLVYYSSKQDNLYALIDGDLHAIDLEEGKEETLVEDLKDGQYVVSEDGRWVAYQTGEDVMTAQTVVVLDLYTSEQYTVEAPEGESILPLGFVGSDFVSGLSRQSDAGQMATGETVAPMYQIEIRSKDQKVVKTYVPEGCYVVGAQISDGMITLNRAVKNGDVYTSTQADYIANSEKKEESNITLESYVTELKETQMRLTYANGIQDQEAKVLKPKQVLAEDVERYVFENQGEGYRVYGLGGFQGSYKKAGDAISRADKVSGVAVTSQQQYLWERGNRDQSYTISGQDATIAAMRERLANGELALEIVKDISDGNELELGGCSTEQMLYLISQNTPVIGVTPDHQSLILIGYRESTVTYINAVSGEESSVTLAQMDQMIGSGGAFIGYLADKK